MSEVGILPSLQLRSRANSNVLNLDAMAAVEHCTALTAAISVLKLKDDSKSVVAITMRE